MFCRARVIECFAWGKVVEDFDCEFNCSWGEADVCILRWWKIGLSECDAIKNVILLIFWSYLLVITFIIMFLTPNTCNVHLRSVTKCSKFMLDSDFLIAHEFTANYVAPWLCRYDKSPPCNCNLLYSNFLFFISFSSYIFLFVKYVWRYWMLYI